MATVSKAPKAASPARKRTSMKSAAASAPSVKTATQPAKAPKAPKAPKAEKPKKPKLVRDSFTIPKVEYAVLESLKARAAKAGVPSKKSEVLRAGIKALAGMGDAAFAAALNAVPSIKTGRPAKA